MLSAAIVVLALAIMDMKPWSPLSPRLSASGDEAWQSASGSAETRYPRTLRDAAGETIVIPRRPRRIVSQTLGTDEILLALCPKDRIAALSRLALDSRYSNVVEEAHVISVPTTQGAEHILRLNPDLVFVASYSRAETVELLRTAGAPVFRFANFNCLEDIKANIRTVGYAIGEEERAEALIARMERQIEAIRARLPRDGRRPRVLSYSQSGYTAGAHTLFDDIVRTVGAVNVAAENGVEGFLKISTEHILAWQPDFIVAGANEGEFEQTRRRLLAEPAIAASRAAERGHIILIDNRYLLSVSHHVVRAIAALADGLYAKVERESPNGTKAGDSNQ